MSATANDLLGDILSLCNDAPETDCPHVVLSHVTGVEGYVEAEATLLGDLSWSASEANTIAAMHGPDAGMQYITERAAHVLAVAVALGYAIGSGHAYESVLAAEIVVPDTLAGQDFLEAG